MLDFATIFGLLVGFVMLIVSLQIGAGLQAFWDPGSIFITFGGAVCATLTQFQWNEIKRLPGVVKQVFFMKKHSYVDVIKEMSRFADIARRDGILALEGVTENVKDDFLVRGIQLAVDGTDPEVIQQMMNTEIDNMLERHRKAKVMIEAFATYAPSFGMLGTLIGLIAMLGNVKDIYSITSNMSLALLTTMYGVIAAYMVARPIFMKLNELSKQEALYKEMIIKGIMSIQSGDNPRIVEQKLKIFIEPRLREQFKK